MTVLSSPVTISPNPPSPARAPHVRRPAIAGRFYSADPHALAQEVQHLLAAGGGPRPAGVRALIAPHAGFACSGEVAGAAYRALASLPPAPRTIYLLGPAHWKAVHGIALPSAAAFATPLGPVPVAADRVADLLARGGQYHLDDAAHAPEHCLEVQLPFLQAVLPAAALTPSAALGHSSAGPAPTPSASPALSASPATGLRIVPLLFDDAADPEAAARDLCALLAGSPDDLLVVSTDLSHYHPYQDAIILDHGFLKALATGDLAAVNAGEACGLLPVLCLMHIAAHFGWRPHLLAYANSGDTCGSRREVVGYGAVAYTAAAHIA
jgi:predicted class III extradiol MEMO1 family dioxygenase